MDTLTMEPFSTAGEAQLQEPYTATDPLRIACITSVYPTSGDTFITSQITGLLDRGHDVRIFALSAQQNLARLHEDIVEYDLLNRLEYHGKPASRSGQLRSLMSDFSSSPLKMMRRLKESRKVRHIDEPTPVFDGYFKLRTYEQYDPFDIITVHFGPIANNMLFLKQLYPKTRYVANFHGYDFSSRVRYHGEDYYNQLWQQADLVTTQSFFSRDCLISLGCPPERVIKHPVGIYLDKFVYRPRRLASPDDDIHMVIVSRLTEKKAHRLILDAFEKVAAERPNLYLNIVGSGNLQEAIEQRIAGSEVLRRQVKMHGWMTQGEVVALLDTCHIFVHPSITTMRWAEMEDTTTVLMEAQAMGLPVIGSYHAGLPEVVLPGESGLLVPERNEDALREAMIALVDHPERWEEMGRTGRAFVEENFDVAMLNARLEWVFNKLHQNRSGEPLGIRSTAELQEVR